MLLGMDQVDVFGRLWISSRQFPAVMMDKQLRKGPSRRVALRTSDRGRESVVECRLVERVAQVFTSFSDADSADEEYYASLSASERVSILLDLIETYQESHGQAAARFERVYRVADLHGG
jgi:hypothetical protein